MAQMVSSNISGVPGHNAPRTAGGVSCGAAPAQDGSAGASLTNLTVAEEALSLSPEDRTAPARLLIQSLETDTRTGEEIKAELNSRLEELLSKKDAGLAFHEVFGSAL